MLRRSAEHAILIISEAVKALDPELLERYPGPNWTGIRAIGNVLRHDYFRVDADVIWDVLSVQLSILRPVIDEMIADLGR